MIEADGSSGKNSWFTKSGNKISNVDGKYIQYKARLVTSNGGPTPYLKKVKIYFE
jgi:hypothetical protein